MDTTTATHPPIAPGVRVKLVKGCQARGLDKGISVQIKAVEPLGAEYSYSVKVTFVPVNGFKAGRTFIFFARHINRLSDASIRLNDGMPSHTIEIQRIPAHAQPNATLAAPK